MENKTKYTRIALAIVGILVDDTTAEFFWRVNERIIEKGGNYSLEDSAEIEALVTKQELKSFENPSSKSEPKTPELRDKREIDFTLKNGDEIFFTVKLEPKRKEDWDEATILDINWALKSASIQVKGCSGPSCVSLASCHKKKFYINTGEISQK